MYPRQQNVRPTLPTLGRRSSLLRVLLGLACLLAPLSLKAVPVEEGYVVQPSAAAAESAARNAARSASPDPVLPRPTMALVYGILFVGGGYVLWRNFRRGRGNLPGGLRGGIEISQSRPMGNRQYLFVAKIDGKRMLLGAGPGFISHLAELPDEPEEEKQDAEDNVRDLPGGGSGSGPSFNTLITRINERLGRPGDPPRR